MNNPLVSILMTVYNAEKYLPKAIESLINQTYTNIEILISDDGSTDKSREVVQKYADQDERIKLHHSTTNLGSIANKNKLFHLATGDLITQQDGDDYSALNRIELQVEAFRNNVQLGAVGTNYYNVSLLGEEDLKHDIKKPVEITIDSPKLYFWPPTLMITREVWEYVGDFNVFFQKFICDDIYWCYRIYERYKTKCLPQGLYYYRNTPGSITNTLKIDSKLASIDLIRELKKQRKAVKSDWVEKKEFEKIDQFVNNLLTNSKWLSEKYRTHAAKMIDHKNFSDAKQTLYKAFRLNPFSLSNFKTYFYYLRAKRKK